MKKRKNTPFQNMPCRVGKFFPSSLLGSLAGQIIKLT